MRCRRVFVWIGAMLTVFFITGLLSAYLIAKPIKLDETIRVLLKRHGMMALNLLKKLMMYGF